jgi:predicted restriction endonuclease
MDRGRVVALSLDGWPAWGKQERGGLHNVEGTLVRRSRCIRDSAVCRRVKLLHGYQCQVCGEILQCQGGPYAEAAHIRPLGRPHDGLDEMENMLSGPKPSHTIG